MYSDIVSENLTTDLVKGEGMRFVSKFRYTCSVAYLNAGGETVSEYSRITDPQPRDFALNGAV